MRIGFDNDKYIALQAEHIRNRIDQFEGKLYLEFGGKLFDDHHAARVLPGFEPDSKIRMLQSLVDDVEIIITINANDIEKNKVRGDLGITYDEDSLRLMDIFRGMGFLVGGVVITHYASQPAADMFRRRLQSLGIACYLHYPIAGYPYDINHIVSDEGYGKNEYIETTRPLVVVTAPGPGSGKMATCLSQLYHEHKRGVTAGYAKYETFPVWNLPLAHPVNLAYEAATVDLDDSNIIDPFHLEAYGVSTVNYNRDVEIFPVLKAMMERISGSSPYQSPTDMGVNMAGLAITDDDVVRDAAKMEIVRRYFQTAVDVKRTGVGQKSIEKLEMLMNQAGVTSSFSTRPQRRPSEGGNDRRARRRHGASRRPRDHGQDVRSAGRGVFAAHECAQGGRGRRRRPAHHQQRGDRADLPPEDRAAGQQEPAPAFRRDAHRAFNQLGHQPSGGADHRARRRPARMRRVLLGHHFRDRREPLSQARHQRLLRA